MIAACKILLSISRPAYTNRIRFILYSPLNPKQKKKQQQDLDPEDIAFKEKQKADAAAKKALMANMKSGKPLVGGGIKKSGKK